MVTVTAPRGLSSAEHEAIPHTSAMIADGAIVDADVNASAAIAQSKLAVPVKYASGDLIYLGEVWDDPRQSTTSTTWATAGYPLLAGWGALFTAPAGTTLVYKLKALLSNSGAGGVTYAEVYDVTADADVSDSTISNTSTAANDAGIKESGELALTPATQKYRIKVKVSAGTGQIFSLRIVVYAKVT